MIEINIPCPDCGREEIKGTCLKDGKKVNITVSTCKSGDGYFELYLLKEGEQEEYYKYKSKEEVEAILSNCYFQENKEFICSECYSCS